MKTARSTMTKLIFTLTVISLLTSSAEAGKWQQGNGKHENMKYGKKHGKKHWKDHWKDHGKKKGKKPGKEEMYDVVVTLTNVKFTKGTEIGSEEYRITLDVYNQLNTVHHQVIDRNNAKKNVEYPIPSRFTIPNLKKGTVLNFSAVAEEVDKGKNDPLGSGSRLVAVNGPVAVPTFVKGAHFLLKFDVQIVKR